MFFGILTLLTALAMAGVAAWFAVAGIVAVFSGAPVAAFIMGSVIELGKIVGVSWLYRNKDEPTAIKYALLPFVLIAMLLTSMGIFGFLSKAHLEQGAPVGNNVAIIERLDAQIVRENSAIVDAETVVKQLDSTVNSLVNNDRISGPNGARAVRETQQPQRAELRETIKQSEQTIAELEDQKFDLSQSVRELELEVGPIKYIAELIYGDSSDRLDDAVRFTIVAFIFVFDPMAILLLVAANYTLMRRQTMQLVHLDKQEDIDQHQAPDQELDEPDPTVVSPEQIKDTWITAEEIKAMLAEINNTSELTPEEQTQKRVLNQLLKQQTIRSKMRHSST